MKIFGSGFELGFCPTMTFENPTYSRIVHRNDIRNLSGTSGRTDKFRLPTGEYCLVINDRQNCKVNLDISQYMLSEVFVRFKMQVSFFDQFQPTYNIIKFVPKFTTTVPAALPRLNYELGIYQYSNSMRLSYRYYTHYNSNKHIVTKYHTWHVCEIYYKLDNVNGFVNIRVDGQQIINLENVETVNSTEPNNYITTLLFGDDGRTSNQFSWTLIDDLVISTEPLFDIDSDTTFSVFIPNIDGVDNNFESSDPIDIPPEPETPSPYTEIYKHSAGVTGASNYVKIYESALHADLRVGDLLVAQASWCEPEGYLDGELPADIISFQDITGKTQLVLSPTLQSGTPGGFKNLCLAYAIIDLENRDARLQLKLSKYSRICHIAFIHIRPNGVISLVAGPSGNGANTGSVIQSGLISPIGNNLIVFCGANHSAHIPSNHRVDNIVADGVITGGYVSLWYKTFSESKTDIRATATAGASWVAWNCDILAFNIETLNPPPEPSPYRKYFHINEHGEGITNEEIDKNCIYTFVKSQRQSFGYSDFLKTKDSFLSLSCFYRTRRLGTVEVNALAPYILLTDEDIRYYHPSLIIPDQGVYTNTYRVFEFGGPVSREVLEHLQIGVETGWSGEYGIAPTIYVNKETILIETNTCVENLVEDFEISNIGASTINVTITGDEGIDGFTIDPKSESSSGELDVRTITLTFNPNIIGKGEYNYTTTITSPEAVNSPVQISVDITVLKNPEIAVDSTGFNIMSVYGEDNTSILKFNIWNAGDGTLNFNIDESHTWFNCNPSSGTSDGELNEIEVSFNTSELPGGDHTGFIIINSDNAINAPISIPIIVTIQENIMLDFVGYGQLGSWSTVSGNLIGVIGGIYHFWSSTSYMYRLLATVYNIESDEWVVWGLGFKDVDYYTTLGGSVRSATFIGDYLFTVQASSTNGGDSSYGLYRFEKGKEPQHTVIWEEDFHTGIRIRDGHVIVDGANSRIVCMANFDREGGVSVTKTKAFISHDGGNTFPFIFDFPSDSRVFNNRFPELVILPDETIFVARQHETTHIEIWKSDISGESLSKFWETDDFTDSPRIVCFGVSDDGQNILIVSIAGTTAYTHYSTNGGDSFSVNTVDIGATVWYNGTSNGQDFVIFGCTELYGDARIFRSTNQGTSFSVIVPPQLDPEYEVWDIARPKYHESTIVYSHEDFTGYDRFYWILYSTDFGLTWNLKNHPLRTITPNDPTANQEIVWRGDPNFDFDSWPWDEWSVVLN